MVDLLSKKWPRRAALALAMLYGLCILAPAAALAFGDGFNIVHCLADDHADDHHEMSADHVHHTGASQTGQAPGPAPSNDDQAGTNKCCGLFSVSAVTSSFDVVVLPLAEISDIAIFTTENLLGRSADPIDRPPRLLLPL